MLFSTRIRNRAGFASFRAVVSDARDIVLFESETGKWLQTKLRPTERELLIELGFTPEPLPENR